MTDQELLLSISNMMDTKLKSELQPIKNDLQTVKDEVKLVRSELEVVKSDLQDTKEIVMNEMQIVRDTVMNEMQITKDTVTHEMQITKDTVANEMQATKDTVMSELQIVKADIHHIKLYQENVIMPRLETIESCYLDTYQRYQNYAEKMEAAFDDIELLKATVSSHTVRIHQLETA